ncbi:MAG TPA: hypothetical protein VFY29_21480 [Terriglobia bacterium]|nr:hypothetical protein [Terriglobia bacterium]
MARRGTIILLGLTACLSATLGAAPQQPAAARGQRGAARGAAAPANDRGGTPRAPLFFREEWKQTPANDEHPITQESVGNPNLELKTYGPPQNEILLTGTATNEANPTHIWTGTCSIACAVLLRDKNNYVDLTGTARIKWVTKTSGFHKVRPVVKLADGTFLVGDREDGSTADWHVSEFSISEVRWMKLDEKRVVTTGSWVTNPNLSRVDEVGFVDLLLGSGHGQGGWSDVAAIEVYGAAVKRTP